MKNRAFNYLITITIIAITTYIITSSSEMGIIPTLLKITNLYYLCGAVVCMMLYWLSDAFIIKAIFELAKIRQSFFSFLKLTMIGQYYNLITPFSSGGQPAQVLTMTNDYKIPLGVATSITVNKFMVYHVVITTFPLLMLILKPYFIFGQNVLSKTLIFTGLGINILGILAIFTICYNSKIVEKIVLAILKILNKFKLAKKIQPAAVISHIKEYKTSLNTFLTNKKTLLLVSVYTLIQITVYFSVTYFIYLSLGLSQASLLDILAVQSLLYMAVNIVPTPGNAGASEGFFFLIFGIIFPSKILLYAIILWRLVIYYFNLAATGAFVFSDYVYKHLKINSQQGNPAK